jgi:hypothetical protein
LINPKLIGLKKQSTRRLAGAEWLGAKAFEMSRTFPAFRLKAPFSKKMVFY